MLGHNFYHRHIRNYVAMFGTIFNDIYIQRDDNSMIKVPIAYGPREKFLARAELDPDLDRPISTYLPRMSFEINSFNYDPTRKLNKTLKLRDANNNLNDSLRTAFAPIPYDIGFELAIMVRNAEDGAKIVEQILPFFVPDFTSTVNFNTELDLKLDIPLVLNGHSIEDTYEGSFETRRALIHTLTFTLKAYFLGPVSTTNVIKFANTSAYSTDDVATANSTNTTALERINTRPGMYANGSPTSNSSASVAYTLINPDDDFGYINIIETTDLSDE